MLERLEAAFESQRRFVANASHELRTPLAIVRTELDVTLDDPDADRDELRAMAYVVRDANERMERLIASLLALASSEAGIVQARPADLAEIVAPALDREEAFADGGALQLDAALASAPVLGDPVLLERLAENLIENAVRYNAAVGWVQVRTGIERGEAVLHIANAGARIDPGAVEELLEPFRRLESSRARSTGGYGLGLAVVRAVAQAHGGRVAVLARREGGLEVTVSLPMASSAAARADRQRAGAGVAPPPAATAAAARRPLRRFYSRSFYSRRFYGSSGRFRVPENPEEGSGARIDVFFRCWWQRASVLGVAACGSDSAPAPARPALLRSPAPARATSTARRPARARRAAI